MPKRAVSSRKAVSSTKRPKHAGDTKIQLVNLTECSHNKNIATTKRSISGTVNPKSIRQDSGGTDEPRSSSKDASKPLWSKRPRSSRAASQKSSTSTKETTIVVKKQKSYKVKIDGDRSTCWITGIAITNDGRIVVVDRNNNTVKAFSKNMKLQSSLTLTLLEGSLFDITIINDKEAVLNTCVHSQLYLLVLDISGDQLRIIRKQPLPFQATATAICRSADKLVAVTERQAFYAVKMFDLSGNVYWTVSEELIEGQCPYVYTNAATHGDTGSLSVAVTDLNQNAVLFISGEDGTVTRKVQLKGKEPRGVTFDSDGNVYVCLSKTHEIIVLMSDMSEEKVLLTKKDKLRENPTVIAYNNKTRCLIVSYPCDFVDVFQIS